MEEVANLYLVQQAIIADAGQLMAVN